MATGLEALPPDPRDITIVTTANAMQLTFNFFFHLVIVTSQYHLLNGDLKIKASKYYVIIIFISVDAKFEFTLKIYLNFLKTKCTALKQNDKLTC